MTKRKKTFLKNKYVMMKRMNTENYCIINIGTLGCNLWIIKKKRRATRTALFLHRTKCRPPTVVVRSKYSKTTTTTLYTLLTDTP